jgi:DNA-binding CsgD family transcriptional regulator
MLDEHLEEILLGVALIDNGLSEAPVLESETASWYSNPYFKQLLSQRELETLKWLSEGHRNDRIAENMNIASVTVNYHLREIKRKLGAQTREQAVAIAFRKGMLR